MEHNIDQPLTLTVEQAAKVLGIGRSTAYELVHTGDIPSLRLGRRIVVPRARLVALLGSSPTTADPGRALRIRESADTKAVDDGGWAADTLF